jgi:hypothetical protein
MLAIRAISRVQEMPSNRDVPSARVIRAPQKEHHGTPKTSWTLAPSAPLWHPWGAKTSCGSETARACQEPWPPDQSQTSKTCRPTETPCRPTKNRCQSDRESWSGRQSTPRFAARAPRQQCFGADCAQSWHPGGAKASCAPKTSRWVRRHALLTRAGGSARGTPATILP